MNEHKYLYTQIQRHSVFYRRSDVFRFIMSWLVDKVVDLIERLVVKAERDRAAKQGHWPKKTVNCQDWRCIGVMR